MPTIAGGRALGDGRHCCISAPKDMPPTRVIDKTPSLIQRSIFMNFSLCLFRYGAAILHDLRGVAAWRTNNRNIYDEIYLSTTIYCAKALQETVQAVCITWGRTRKCTSDQALAARPACPLKITTCCGYWNFDNKEFRSERPSEGPRANEREKIQPVYQKPPPNGIITGGGTYGTCG